MEFITSLISREAASELVPTKIDGELLQTLVSGLTYAMGQEALLDTIDQLDQMLETLLDNGITQVNESMFSAAMAFATPQERIAKATINDFLLDEAFKRGKEMLDQAEITGEKPKRDAAPDITDIVKALGRTSNDFYESNAALHDSFMKNTGYSVVDVTESRDDVGARRIRFVFENMTDPNAKQVVVWSSTAKDAMEQVQRLIKPGVSEVREALGEYIEAIRDVEPLSSEPTQQDLSVYSDRLECHRRYRMIKKNRNHSKALMTPDLSSNWTYWKFQPIFARALEDVKPTKGDKVILIGTGTSQCSGMIYAALEAFAPLSLKVHCFDPDMEHLSESTPDLIYHPYAFDPEKPEQRALLENAYLVVSDAAVTSKQSFCGALALEIHMQLLEAQHSCNIRVVACKANIIDAVCLPCHHIFFGRYHNHECFHYTLHLECSPKSPMFLSDKQVTRILETKDRNNCRRNAMIHYGIHFHPARDKEVSKSFKPRPPERGCGLLAKRRDRKIIGQSKKGMSVGHFSALVGTYTVGIKQTDDVVRKFATVVQHLSIVRPDIQMSNVLTTASGGVVTALLGRLRSQKAVRVKQRGSDLSSTQKAKAREAVNPEENPGLFIPGRDIRLSQDPGGKKTFVRGGQSENRHKVAMAALAEVDKGSRQKTKVLDKKRGKQKVNVQFRDRGTAPNPKAYRFDVTKPSDTIVFPTQNHHIPEALSDDEEDIDLQVLRQRRLKRLEKTELKTSHESIPENDEELYD